MSPRRGRDDSSLSKVQPMRSARIAPGYYEVLGTTHCVEVKRVVYPGDGVYWALVIDGRCDDIYPTKREALQACQADPTT